jgi:rhodanese-related sulfurtransferase
MGLALAAGMFWWGTGARANTAPQDAPVNRMAMTHFSLIQGKRGALVIDVRSPDSFHAGHIPGAINIPVDDVAARVRDVVSRAAGRPIVTYCSCISEHTSAIAAQTLTSAGVKNVSALVGGFPAWVAQGGAIERELVPIRVV